LPASKDATVSARQKPHFKHNGLVLGLVAQVLPGRTPIIAALALLIPSVVAPQCNNRVSSSRDILDPRRQSRTTVVRGMTENIRCLLNHI
jgi:hypothetical protein